MEIIRDDQYQRIMDEKVCPYLECVKKEGETESFDGASLHWVRYEAEDPQRTVVMLHGFTESAQKYQELIWYLVNSGSNVFIFDQRGHGKSFRHVPDKTITHVERFEDYVADFETVMEKAVPHDLPLRLFSHSMGGAVAGLYLEKHQDVFDKAVLSSPMIAPSTGGVPVFAGKLICRVNILFGGAKKRIFLSSEYPGEEKFEDSCDTCRERFERYNKFRAANPDYQNYSPSYRWTLESLKVTKKLLKKGEPEKIRAKVILFSAGKDTVVNIPEQKLFADRVPDCEFVTVPEAKHEIYYSTDDVLEPYVNRLIDFLR